MEQNFEPFKVVEEDGRTILRLHGTKEERAKVEANKVHLIMDAIVQGWDVEALYADIEGDLNISKIAEGLDKTEDGKWVIKGNIRMLACNISGNAFFASAQFSGDAGFAAQFSGDANFDSAQFGGNAYFSSAQFSGFASFHSAQFSGDVRFGNVLMVKPASFADVTFSENHVIKGLWNATLGRMKRLHWQATDFSGFNTERAMDGASNPWLKRYIDDELWIQSWRTRPKWRWWRELWFTIWELTSHCGRSIGLWVFWSVLIALVFGFLHKGHIEVGSVNNWYTPFYFSVVTFTTLGFGDVTPRDGLGQLWITLEVVLGYIMLGGLISIFANKLARRS